MFLSNIAGKNYKWEIVILLWIAFFLNQADRQAFNIVLPQIQSFLCVSDSVMGLIAMLFNIFYAITVPFAGYYADRLSRSRQIIISTFVFSVSTLLTGFSNTLFLFVLYRCAGMGVGQGMFSPAYPGLIAEYHDDRTRARAMGIHQSASYVGVICCGLLTGYIADKIGWQYSFYIFGGLGILFTVVMVFRLRDRIKPEVQSKPSFSESISAFFKVPTAVCILIAFTGGLFVITGFLTWMPKLLKETFSMSTFAAGFHSMFWTNVAAFIGVLLGGYVNDRIKASNYKNGAPRLVVQALSLILASPFIFAMGYSSCFGIVCLSLFFFGFFRGVFESCSYPILYNVISSKYYSMSSAILILFGFSIGALAPWVIGIIGDNFGLSYGISLLGVVWVVASISLFIARFKFYQADYIK